MTTHLADRAVELVIQHVETLVLVSVADLTLPQDQSVESIDIGGLRVRGGKPDGRALERLAHELRVVYRALADPGDERAELGHDLDKTVVAQADQSLSDRRPAHAEALGQLILGELATRLELTALDG